MVLLEMIEVRKRRTAEARRRDFGREGLKEINSCSPCFSRDTTTSQQISHREIMGLIIPATCEKLFFG